ncbi:MAG: hypothetical protein ACRDAX_01620 [Propionibacteriaceae bacterium]
MGTTREETLTAINLRLSLLGLPTVSGTDLSEHASRVAAPLIARQRELSRRLDDQLSAPDQRIEAFLTDYLADTGITPRLPRRTLVLDQSGLARELSLPVNGDTFTSDIVSSYRLVNGVLHNPSNDRRTTAGVFHIAEGGLPIPDDKKAVPVATFGMLLEKAFQPPRDSMILPFTSENDDAAACFVSLYLKPIVVPAVPGFTETTVMETRFIVPGGLVSNLDFVEGIFGNAGDPSLPDNDAALDPEHWCGATGLVVLAPHLTKVTKKSVGLPHISAATERQKQDGMCWESDDELYNDGSAFKVCARDERGVIVTVIADNYFGYCKKEVKTQLSYAANLFGLAEEEHSGGTIAYQAWNLGEEWYDFVTPTDATVSSVIARDPKLWQYHGDGYATCSDYPQIVLVPAAATYSLREQTISWEDQQGTHHIPLSADRTYLTPNGYRVHAKARDADPTQWHLIGISAQSTQCHKPATVSGGGKSEISKSILDAFVFGNAYVADADADMDKVAELLNTDYSTRFKDPTIVDHRPLLSPERTLGSVIKLLTPSPDYTDTYNQWLAAIPAHIFELLHHVKRYYQPSWGDDWRSHFSVGIMNGRKGNALRLHDEKIMVNMLRVGFDDDGAWRLFSLRPDFSPSRKVQTEDDITASVVAPALAADQVSEKFVTNCEQLLFQRPDDAIHRGYDKQTEHDMALPGTFISNFQPIDRPTARELVRNAPAMSTFTAPMRQLIETFAAQDDELSPRYLAVSSEPRIVNGARTKNPRYLQVRPDLSHPVETAEAYLASRLNQGIGLSDGLRMPVNAVIAGRRNNAAEPGIPPLCAYNPLHFMELPELLMEFISSMTGKSPSTTGAGSEGAMTKGPFNALPAIYDLNAALLAYALTGSDGWISSAGVIGPHHRVDHDISLLIPELFCRMSPQERDAHTLIEAGYLEKINDIEFEGRIIEASRLGYRMNERFAATYFGRIFLHPNVVFTPDMLAPELQDLAVFAESVDVICATHRRVAQMYFADGTISLATPPIKALLEIMATGTSSQGWTLSSPEFRNLFTREAILASNWYQDRISAKQEYDQERLTAAASYLTIFMNEPSNSDAVEQVGLSDRLDHIRSQQQLVASDHYRDALQGTLGRQAQLH